MRQEKPILFSTDMVQAILNRRKTQTRRIIKGIPANYHFQSLVQHASGRITFARNDKFHITDTDIIEIKNRYGNPGDLLWARESFCSNGIEFLGYRADCSNPEIIKDTRWRPSIHMPKNVSRIWLEITSIEPELVKSISEEDAIAEGVYCYGWDDPAQTDYKNYEHSPDFGDDWGVQTARLSYETLWTKINGLTSWESNPWVWAISFKILSTTGRPDNL